MKGGAPAQALKCSSRSMSYRRAFHDSTSASLPLSDSISFWNERDLRDVESVSDMTLHRGKSGGDDALVGLANLGQLPLALVAREAEQVEVVLEQARAVRDGDERCGRGRVSVRSSATQGSPTGRDALMPRSLACWYIEPSTSVETADVHSSRTPYLGRW